VEWQPIVTSRRRDAQWEESFVKYRATPEFRVRNPTMPSRVQGHLLVGTAIASSARIIGLAFLVPFIYFVARGRVRGALVWKLGGIFLLGALQGVLGWYMVQSGLVDDPRVSSVRLAAHLGLAFLIYAFMLWVALGLLWPVRTLSSDAARKRAGFMVRLTFVMVLPGRPGAATRAGLPTTPFR
jgi:cytochrome c oxidase assembly protein subunit 15